jgi:RNA-binding protein
MDELEGFQRRHLRGLAHPLKPVVMIGKEGLSDAVVAKAEAELLAHELIKVRFSDWKDEKREIMAALAARTQAELVGVVGHVGILFRQNREPKRRKIRVPARPRRSSHGPC